jgi:hypothetical protein
MTALHCMLKKGSDRKHVAMLIAHGARGDIENAEGVTAIDILSRKKGPPFARWPSSSPRRGELASPAPHARARPAMNSVLTPFRPCA